MKDTMDTDLIKNALRCMAVCDAVGAEFEFVNDPTPADVLDFAAYNDLEITDDTQMTLFGFDSVIQNYSIQRAYLDWYITQTEDFSESFRKPGLLSFESLWKDREPGMTCLRSLRRIHLNGLREKNDSKGCGAVMRLLPCMLIDNIEDRLDWINKSIRVTHDHPECERAAIHLMYSYMGFAMERHGEFIEEYGQGWTAQSAVDMAIWSVNNSKTFDELLVNSICHGGDSDSVAAIAGSIWGMLGKDFDYYDRVVEKPAIEYVLSSI